MTTDVLNGSILNIAAYRFVSLDDLPRRRRELKAACDARQLKGTILLSREGVNLFMAGEEPQVRDFLELLRADQALAPIEVKESWTDYQPFNRMLVRLKNEIISMGVPEIDPRVRTSPKLKAAELKQWLDEGRDLVLLDTRNDYEVQVGTFDGALPIGVDSFRDFPEAVRALPDEMKQKPIVMFCTGGIRCEKAGPLMEAEGFQQVFQLDGGILKYFDECGGAHYHGDCFVFDKRVALNPELKESGIGLCYACQAILSPEDMQSPDYVYEQSCPYCISKLHASLPSIADREAAIRVATTPLPGSEPYDNMRPIRIPQTMDGMTLGECVLALFPHYDQTYWNEEFALGRIKLGEQLATPETIVKAGQRYAHWFPNTIEPDVNVDIQVLFEDDALVVVHKPAPLPMHPSGRFNRNTLTWILRQAFGLHGLRPAHRLDANTTGVAVFAKTRTIAGDLQMQFDRGLVEKIYLAEIAGTPTENEFRCDAPLSRERSGAGGRDVAADESAEEALAAVTDFRIVQVHDNGTTLVEAMPQTGRTHQIRLHLWHLGMPILGDPMYLPGQQLAAVQTLEASTTATMPMRLHAAKLTLRHPVSGETITFTSPKTSWGQS